VNHFEELGLGRSAGPDEIRQAYRSLASLLHPDRQRTDQHRRLADLQMKRLNAAIETLLDPARRTDYETELDAPRRRSTVPQVIVVPSPAAEPDCWRGAIDPRSVLLFAAGAVFATVLWYSLDSSRAAEARNAQPLASEATVEAALRSRLAEMEERVQNLEKQRSASSLRGDSPDGSSRFAGTWYYDLGAQSGPSQRLASKRIDLRITDDNGVLHGTYRSQVNPFTGEAEDTISFDFSGKGDPRRTRLPWTTSDGGSGEIELHLIGRDTLDTRWWAFSLGKAVGENHGSAVLRRRLAPIAP
jgi:curved DNA-binding protein CbpA